MLPLIGTVEYIGVSLFVLVLPITIWNCCGPCEFESVDTSVQAPSLIGISSENNQLWVHVTNSLPLSFELNTTITRHDTVNE